MIIKKKKKMCPNLKGKSLIEIIENLGFQNQQKGLCIFSLLKRKGISQILICIAKKKIRESVVRNLIKRRIKYACKRYIKKIQILLTICLFWKENKIPSLKKIDFLIKKIFKSNIIYYML